MLDADLRSPARRAQARRFPVHLAGRSPATTRDPRGPAGRGTDHGGRSWQSAAVIFKSLFVLMQERRRRAKQEDRPPGARRASSSIARSTPNSFCRQSDTDNTATDASSHRGQDHLHGMPMANWSWTMACQCLASAAVPPCAAQRGDYEVIEVFTADKATRLRESRAAVFTERSNWSVPPATVVEPISSSISLDARGAKQCPAVRVTSL